MSEFEELTKRALALPAKSRAELAELLIQSLEEDDDQDLKDAWLAEIHRRNQEIRAGASVTQPADHVLREAREHLRCLTLPSTRTPPRKCALRLPITKDASEVSETSSSMKLRKDCRGFGNSPSRGPSTKAHTDAIS